MKFIGKKSTILLIYISLLDFSLIIFNTIYHFIKHGMYKTPIGIIFIISFIIIMDIAFILNKSNDESVQNITALLSAILGIMFLLFLIIVLIKSFILSNKKPIILLIEYIIGIISLISIVILESDK